MITNLGWAIVTEELGYSGFRARSWLHCDRKAWTPGISGTIMAPL
ncbi:hypothetical protein [Neobacillus niacini]